MSSNLFYAGYYDVPLWIDRPFVAVPEHDIGAGHEASFLRELGDKSHTLCIAFPLDFSMHLRKTIL